MPDQIPPGDSGADTYTPPTSTGAVTLRRESSGIIQCSKHAATGKVDATAKGLAMGLSMFWRMGWVRELPTTKGWLEADSRIALELIRLAGGPAAWVSRLLWLPGLCPLLVWLGERRVPGAAAHVLCRKIWFQDLVSRALSGGCRQVVVLGAGLDPRALRLWHQHQDVVFVEFDLSAAMRVKARYLHRYLHRHRHRHLHRHRHSADNLLLMGQDLTRDHALTPLRELPAFDVQAPTLALAEGLLMYLPQDRAQALLRNLRRTVDGPLTVAFTCLDADPDRDHGIDTVQRLLRRRRLTPFQWRIDTTDLAGWLHGCGLTPQEIVDGDALQTVSLPSNRRGPGFGELMVLAM
jgi:methyltransferase (TIGR00027 family)